jgi:hypothetical protein
MVQLRAAKIKRKVFPISRPRAVRSFSSEIPLDASGGMAHAITMRGKAGQEVRGGTMSDFTPYQQKIIKRYYDNQDVLQLQRLAEMVSELYLSTGKKRQGVWTHIVTAMQKLGVPQSRIDHLRQQDKAELVAEVVKELEGRK